ncbi:Global transcription regulator sge1 [Thecaphora frezii]
MSSINKGTFQGYVSSTQDALLIFEAVRRGIMPKITRRLREDERGLIKSGTVFVFDERESGIKRWTDGLLWSPSRILMNFLVYRQIDRKSVRPGSDQPAFATSQPGFPLPSAPMDPAPPGSGVRPLPLPSSGSLDEAGMVGSLASYGSSSVAGSSVTSSSSAFYADAGNSASMASAYPPQSAAHGQAAAGMVVPAASGPAMMRRESELERSLVGSLTSSYPFLKDGLCKKTISIQVEGSTQHLISYYTVDDVRSGRLRTPSSLPEIAALCISPIFLNKSNFRNPPHIEVGPDGIPRYRGDSAESPSARLASGHHSSSEGTSSGSDSRDARSIHSPGNAMVLYSPSSMLADGSQVDPYMRHAHQIGGSGTLMTTSTASSGMYGGPGNHRRSSDTQNRRSSSRYEPYSITGHYGHNSAATASSAAASPYASYYSLPGHPGSSVLSRKSSNASTPARSWTMSNPGQSSSPGQAATPLNFPAHAIGHGASLFAAPHGDNANLYEATSSESLYPMTSGGGGASQTQQHASSSSSSSSTGFPLRLPHSFQSDPSQSPVGASVKAEPMTSTGQSSVFQFSRPYRGSWDSNQPSMTADGYFQDAQPPPATSQGLTTLSLYSQGRVAAEEAQPSPPPTSSSYSSHHSFISHAHAHATAAAGSAGIEAPFGSRSRGESLAHALSDQRRPASSLASSYQMPPPSTPAAGWQAHDLFDNGSGGGGAEGVSTHTAVDRGDAGDAAQSLSSLAFHAESARSQQSFWSHGGEVDTTAIKREDLWDLGDGGASSARTRTDAHEAPSVSASEEHQQRAKLEADGAQGGGGGLERVVLTKPAA